MTKEELEKEAEDFTDSKKSFWRQGRTCIDSVKQAYLAGAEPREKRIAELENENAELRTKLNPENCLKLLAKEGYIKFTSDQLTKAKEIIKRYVKIYVNPYPEEEVELRNEAEQFLEEVSE